MKYYQIYYYQQILCICEDSNNNITQDFQKNCFICKENVSIDEILTLFLKEGKNILLPMKSQVAVLQKFNEIKSHFSFHQAAGGLVLKNEQILLIFRYNKWDLPKGHIEKGETAQQAAIREVTEETNIDNLLIINELKPTYHIYPPLDNSDYILKETQWFVMQTSSNQPPKPQSEEDITVAQWFPIKNIPSIIKDIYPSLRENILKIRVLF
ncbi:MAG: NUDIX domain-containing protein [Bacteroidales bacterium]|jgi:8-oxo-dGTP pyrophosphatase MutT (NUDIX family)|nr:NUDIX domain-containing protein [Bacteroidales bacterium]